MKQNQNIFHSQTSKNSYPSNAFKRQKSLNSPITINRVSIQDIPINDTKQSKVKENQNRIDEADHQSQSEEQQLKKEAEDIVNQIRKKQQIKKANNKMVVGSGFSFDITEFFKFQKKKQLQSKEGDLFGQLSGSVLAWVILLYSIVNSAIIPGWIMNIKATKLLRICWRFLLQSVMVIPFVLYEYRVGNQQVKSQYKLSYIFKPVHLKKIYLSSISSSIWYTCILTAFQWAYVSHGLVLGALSNFFLSIYRSFSKTNHDIQPGGQLLVVLGIILVIYDSITLVPEQEPAERFDVINPFYLTRQWYQRVGANLFALAVSFTQCNISRYTADMKSHYPPSLSILLVNIFVCINMIFSTYFLNGLTFDYDQQYGLFSIFSQMHFASFLYMGILLNSGLFISLVMISKLFPDPIFPALAMTLEPMLASFFVQVFGVQLMPNPISFVGYLLILPGVIVILIGQCLYQRKKPSVEEQNKKSIEIINEMKALRKVTNIKERRQRLTRAKTLKEIMDEGQKPEPLQKFINSPTQQLNDHFLQPNNKRKISFSSFTDHIRESLDESPPLIKDQKR